MNRLRFSLLALLVLCVVCANAQKNWHYNFGLGASLNAGNVNNCNISNDGAVERNDSLIAFDAHYKLLYSSLIDKSGGDQHWKETNFEVNGGVKMDLFQHDKYSPFLACEMLTNKYKGYDLRLSGLVGMKYRIYTIPGFCDYSISAAFVYDWTDFTDETHLLNNNYRISIRPKVKQKLAENLTLVHPLLSAFSARFRRLHHQQQYQAADANHPKALSRRRVLLRVPQSGPCRKLQETRFLI